MHDTADQVMFIRVGLPFEFYQLLKGLRIKDLHFLRIVTDVHKRYILIDPLVFTSIRVVFHVEADLIQKVYRVFYFEDFRSLISFFAMNGSTKFFFRKYSLILVPQMKEGFRVASEALSIIDVISGPFIVVISYRKDVTVE